MLLGGNFLDYFVLDHDPVHGQQRGIFWVEVGVAVTVSGVMLKIFYMFADRGKVDDHDRCPGLRGSGHFSYFVTVFLMVAGLFIVIARGNLIKKLVGLGIFQTSVYLLYIAPGKLDRRHRADPQRRASRSTPTRCRTS